MLRIRNHRDEAPESTGIANSSASARGISFRAYDESCSSYVTSRTMSKLNSCDTSSHAKTQLVYAKAEDFVNDSKTEDMYQKESSLRSSTAQNQGGEGMKAISFGDPAEVDSQDPQPIIRPMHEIHPTTRLAKAELSKPRLTLSAFRRPEQTVRLSDSDPSRDLLAEYDLHGPECGILGHGAFSTVRLAVRRHDRVKVAVKSIAKHEALRARRLRANSKSNLDEWDILRLMSDHPYIITLLDVFETDEEIHLITEFCEGGELFDAIQKKRNQSHAVCRGHYSEPQAALITSQLLRALADLHREGIVHRDVKPENILLMSENDSNIHAKLCDFGMARRYRWGDSVSDTESPPTTPKGRVRSSSCSLGYYSAPEVGFGSSNQPSVDIYSLGVTMYILLCGFPPVMSHDVEPQVLFPQTHWSTISNDAKRLIRRMLAQDPSKRINAESALVDNWFATNLQRRPSVPRSQKRKKEFMSLPTTPTDFDLQMVRERLYSAVPGLKNESVDDRDLDTRKRQRSEKVTSPKRIALSPRRSSLGKSSKKSIKRPRLGKAPRQSSLVQAISELYREVACVSASATAAAAVVFCDSGRKVRVVQSGSALPRDEVECPEAYLHAG